MQNSQCQKYNWLTLSLHCAPMTPENAKVYIHTTKHTLSPTPTYFYLLDLDFDDFWLPHVSGCVYLCMCLFMYVCVYVCVFVGEYVQKRSLCLVAHVYNIT
mmetsp:Transcript_43894/g.64445  ORF Transcript_43894/g.64445 Transcript_43894/m.64445 type:complete len:101 (+) Transcript_43894:546-848(+)